nr:hypothetical protein GCM10025699_69820 [Microbacterium flavescens]
MQAHRCEAEPPEQGPCCRETLCMRGSGTITSRRQTAPVRSRTAPGAERNPLRRHENQRSTAARRGETVKPPSAPRDVSPSSTIDTVRAACSPAASRNSCAAPAGSEATGSVDRAGASSAPPSAAATPTSSGSTNSSTRRTSVMSPTGSRLVLLWPSAPLVLDRDARLIEISHQPKGRHSRGWLTLTEWMRPGGRVSFVVENSP